MTGSPDLSALPRVDDVVAAADELVNRHGRRAATESVRQALDEARASMAAGRQDRAPSPAEVAASAADLLAARRPGPPRRVINATGVIVHTNLGRAPLSSAAIAATVAAAGCCDLEVDLGSGERSSRDARLEPLLCEATGAEAATVVNNAAAALVLLLAAIAHGRQVCVSRGQLVEIGGEFRLPDIMAASGVELVEVGTTNRTRAADFYAGDDVALLLAVHPSNYAVVGFTETPTTQDLAAVASDRTVPLVFDVGSGLLGDDPTPCLDGESSVAGALRDGADLVVCSGDKLLGGPQAGVLVGRRDLVERCRRHPLARALRLDKLRIAALAVTLEAHLDGRSADVPVTAMIATDLVDLRRRSAELADSVGGEVVTGRSVVGGGASPTATIEGPVVAIRSTRAGRIADALRMGAPPIVARVADGALQVDLRSVDPADDPALREGLTAALRVTEGSRM